MLLNIKKIIIITYSCFQIYNYKYICSCAKITMLITTTLKKIVLENKLFVIHRQHRNSNLPLLVK